MPSYSELYHTPAMCGASGGGGFGFVLGEVGRHLGKRLFEVLARGGARTGGDGGEVTPGGGIGLEGRRNGEVQRGGELVFGVGEIAAAVEQNAAIQVGFPGGQVLGVG